MSILSSLLGLGQGQPTQVIPTAIAEPTIAKEIAPFLKDILGKGQALYKQRMDEGFVPYEGQTLADVTAQQKAAQEGIAGLVGTQKPIFDEAGVLVREGTEKATAEALQPYMNPYQQAVTDIAKRDAQERFEQTTLPTLRKQAIDAGVFGGSRAAMRESQAQDAQARLLADLQAKGDLAAFQNAQQQFAAQKAREAQTAQGLTGLATQQFGAQTKELGQLEAVGREEQQRQQQLLDESYKRFLQERTFPEQQLGQYQQIVAGVPISQSSVEYKPQQFQPSPIASALGTAQQISDIYGAFSPKKSATGGLVDDGGLSSLPVIQRQENNQVMTEKEKIKKIIKSAITGVSDPNMDTHLLEQSLGENISNKNENEESVVAENSINEIPSDIETTNTFGVPSTFDANYASSLQDLDQSLLATGDESTDKPTGYRAEEKVALADASSGLTKYYNTLEALNRERQANIKTEQDERRELERKKILRGIAKGLLATKEGRGGLLADIQAGLGKGVEARKEFEGDEAAFREKSLQLRQEEAKQYFDKGMQQLNLARARGDIDDKEYSRLMQKLTLDVQKIAAGVSASDRAETLYSNAQSQSRDLLSKYAEGTNPQFLINQIAESVQNQVGIGRYPSMIEEVLTKMNVPKDQINKILAGTQTAQVKPTVPPDEIDTSISDSLYLDVKPERTND